MNQEIRLKNFPVALFSSVMGFAALTIAIQQAESLFFENNILSVLFIILTSILFLLNVSIFGYRLLRHPLEVKSEFNHFIQMNFFGTITISLSLLALLYADIYITLSFILWVLAAILQLLLTFRVLTVLMWNLDLKLEHLTPVTFIPIVGNLLIPLAGVKHAAEEINWFYFSIGIFFSIIFMTLMLYRLFFQKSLMKPMQPTIFIYLAPPSVAFVAYTQFASSLNSFAYFLYSVALFIILLLLFQIRKILSVPFFVSWWAILFPTAAFTVASLRVYEATKEILLLGFIIFLFIILFIIAIYLVWKTLYLFFSKNGNNES